jgi:hypothetical protein
MPHTGLTERPPAKRRKERRGGHWLVNTASLLLLFHKEALYFFKEALAAGRLTPTTISLSREASNGFNEWVVAKHPFPQLGATPSA